MKKGRPHLYVVSKLEPLIEGPITRLELWKYFPPVSKKKTAIFVVSKLVVLAVVLYIMLGQ